MEKRLLRALEGYFSLMKADYEFSASHKLPGSIGRMRENSVVEFLRKFVSRDVQVASSVFAVTSKGAEYERELDVVLFDGSCGGFWELDRFGENSVCTFEGIKLVIEVKSTIERKELEDALKKAEVLKQFASDHNINPPPFVLFGYNLSAVGLDLIEDKTLGNTLGLDAVICPETLCYFHHSHDDFSFGFERGLSANNAKGDGSAIDSMMCSRPESSRYALQYKSIGDGPGSRLLALAAFASHAAGDDSRVEGLLAAALNPQHNPIFPKED